MPAETALFVLRDACINCKSRSLRELSSGSFDANPLHDFIANDPWGENPIDYLRGQSWQYLECTECGTAFHGRILAPEWSARKFERWMTTGAIERFLQRSLTPQAVFDRAIHFTRRAMEIEVLTRDLRDNRALRVLDFGCGDGEFIDLCALLGFDACGIERSAARKRGNRGTVYPRVEDLTGEPFHAITLYEVLEHLDDPGAILECLAPLLIPGGILLLETPDCSGSRSIETRGDYDAIHPLEHINGFTPPTLRRFAERRGFTAIASPCSHVTCELTRVVRTEMKRLLKFAVPARTQQYFRRTGL
jgi:SAM-dependent methyltransferase